METHFELYYREDGKVDWRLKAGNNTIVGTSGGQGYRDLTDGHRGIADFVNAVESIAHIGVVPVRIIEREETPSVTDQADAVRDAGGIVLTVDDDS